MDAATDRSVVVFSEYADTAEYLANLIADLGRNVDLITSSLNIVDRQKTVQNARLKPRVLVITTAESLGLDLGISDQVIHYDMPQRTMNLLHRYGRTERLGSEHEVFNHHRLLVRGNFSDDWIDVLDADIQNLE